MHLVYLHGFNSSPASEKAQQARRYFSSVADVSLHVPALPPEPRSAMGVIEALIARLQGESLGFIGSSLGGYYSLYWHQRIGCPAVLVNPAMRPYELLCDYLGENTNLYTGEVYEVKPEHMEQLKALEAHTLSPRQIFLLTQTGDEVLDYRQALDKVYGARAWIKPHGDHAFQAFESTLPAIEAFFRGRLS